MAQFAPASTVQQVLLLAPFQRALELRKQKLEELSNVHLRDGVDREAVKVKVGTAEGLGVLAEGKQ